MIYCIVGDDLKPLVEKAFPENDRIEIGDDRWLVRSDDAISMTVWNRLEKAAPTFEGPPVGIVFPVRGYFGRHSPATWEWLAAKQQVGHGL